MGGRRISRIARDDEAVAGAVGLLLVLALLVTGMAQYARTEIPLRGAEVETEWAGRLKAALESFRKDLSVLTLGGEGAAVVLPGPGEPPGLSIPLLGSFGGAAADGHASVEPGCAIATVRHAQVGKPAVVDANRSSPVCLLVRMRPAYGDSASFRLELGGLLRIQGDRAVVIHGPVATLSQTAADAQRVSVVLPGLRGPQATAGFGPAGVRVDASAVHAAGEITPGRNAAWATLNFTTTYPAAWKTWWEAEFAAAGFVASRASPPAGVSAADYTVACAPADCSTPGGAGRVEIRLEGPRTDRDDLEFSLAYAPVDLSLG